MKHFEPIDFDFNQKQIYSVFKTKRDTPKLVLYIAPTATGKTLTPLGLSQEYKVIFVCAARHVGIALAKSAISVSCCSGCGPILRAPRNAQVGYCRPGIILGC